MCWIAINIFSDNYFVEFVKTVYDQYLRHRNVFVRASLDFLPTYSLSIAVSLSIVSANTFSIISANTLRILLY